MKHLVFVYGSLKKGFGNHYWMEGVKGKFIGNGVTKEPKFKLYSFQDIYPAISFGNEKISGELYKVNNIGLRYLDYLEGYPSYYNRKKFLIECDGKTYKAFIYYINNIKNTFGKELPSESERIKRENNIATWIN